MTLTTAGEQVCVCVCVCGYDQKAAATKSEVTQSNTRNQAPTARNNIIANTARVAGEIRKIEAMCVRARFTLPKHDAKGVHVRL